MILYTIIALSLISGTLFTVLLGLMDKWYDVWILLVSYLAFLFVYVLIFLLFIVVYTSFISLKKEPKPSKFLTRLIKRISELLIQICKVKVHVRGIEKLPENQKCLFVSNHISNFDPLISEWAFRPYDFSFIVKISLMKVPFVKKALHKDLHLALDRENNRQGLEVVLKSIKLIKEDKRSIYV